MRYIISDITGRTLNYDFELCKAVKNSIAEDNVVEFWGQNDFTDPPFKVRSFSSIVSKKNKSKSSSLILAAKAFEAVCSYVRIVFLVALLKPSTFHLQWFPFLSLGIKGGRIDIFFVKLLKLVSKTTRLVFTIHNLCPHSMKDDERDAYNIIFAKALALFDSFVVHTEQTKEDVCMLFHLAEDSVNVIHHGVFVPESVKFERKEWNPDEVRIIMYGAQNWYKGTDIFVDAISLLPKEIKSKIQVSICGVVDSEMEKACSNKDTGLDINWMSFYLTDQQLYEEIEKSDIIVLPYRRISQSGVLLLALATKRIIVTSDLPTFKETLSEYSDDLFFKSGDPQSFARLLGKYVDGTIERTKILDSLELLCEKYSWTSAAQKTICLYRSIKVC